MCVGDWRLGRLIRSSIHNIVAPSSGDTLVERNRDRVGLTIATPDALADNTVQVEVELGVFRSWVILTPDNCMMHITLSTHGDLPTRKWRCGSNLPGIDYIVTEYFLPERVLSDIISRYYSEYKLW